MINRVMKKIYRVVWNVAWKTLNYYRDIRALYYLTNWNKRRTTGDKIRIGFIVQMPEIWDKEEPIFERMRSNPEFVVTLIVVPPYDMINKRVTTDYADNYFLLRYGSDAIKGYENGQWINMAEKYDYVFFQRPYDHYLPRELQSRTIVKYARCCYIPYGFSG